MPFFRSYASGGGGTAGSTVIRKNVMFRGSNVTASATANMGRLASTTTENFWVAPRACTITAMSCDMTANVTAGDCTFQITLDGVAQTDANSVLVVSTAAPIRFDYQVLATPISVAAGVRVGAVTVCSADMAPTGTSDPVLDIEITETS